MPFPVVKPSSRTFEPGAWPVKTFRTQNGVEARVLYGNKRTGMTMQLAYQNVPDTTAELFVLHYIETKGTYDTFTIGDLTSARAGWGATLSTLGAIGPDYANNAWRYAEAPSIQSVKPGISNVSVKLVAVL